jgi:anti-anti-sigma regulatory factor
MEIVSSGTDGDEVHRLVGSLRLAGVAAAAAALLALLAQGRALRLDLAAIDECDTAGVQLLLMARASARARGTRFAAVGHSAALHAALARVGIAAAELDSPQSATG